jgi:hypothetical protein
LLSGRVIHYTSEELVWECRILRICECGLYDHDAGLAKAQFEKQMAKRDVRWMASLWHKVVSTFTTLNLTFEDDKFLALSGIAEQLIG